MAGPRRRFVLACLVEGGLLALAAPIAWLAGVPLLGDLRWSAADAGYGALAIAPMLALPWWLLRSRHPAARALCALVFERLAPLFDGWRLHELLAVCALAGIAEEALFRAVIQGALGEAFGPVPALLAASILFGLVHAVTRLYAVLAALIGLYLGALWMLTGNLLAPVVAHAGYDAIALLWLVRAAPAWREGRR